MTYCEVIYSKDYIMMKIFSKENTSLILWVFCMWPTAEAIQVEQHKNILSVEGSKQWLNGEYGVNCSEHTEETSSNYTLDQWMLLKMFKLTKKIHPSFAAH